MAQETDDGMAYLQALKQSAPAAAAAAPARTSTQKSGMPQNFPGPEKRRSPRYKCEASAEIWQRGSESRTWATCTDISMHGCYVEATATHPVGSNLHLRLQTNQFQVETEGCVRVVYPSLGMGIAFTQISDENRSLLKELLRTISRPSVILGSSSLSSPVPAAATISVALPSDAAAALRALAEFFESRQLLMRDEFLRILRKVQTDSNPAGQTP